MANTTYYNLNKPGQNDFYDIDVFNENIDIIDAELHNLSEVFIYSATEPAPAPGKIWLKPLT